MASPAQPRLSAPRTGTRPDWPRTVLRASRRLTVLLPGGHPPPEQQARIFEENRRWIEAGCRLRPDIADLEGAHRLLFRHYGDLVGHWQPAAIGDATALHEVRIALRRLSTVLRAFRKRLKPTSAGELCRHLRQLNRALGPARDLNVWLEFLRDAGEAKADVSRYLVVLQRQRKTRQRAVCRLLGNGAFRVLQSRFDSLLRVELPQLWAEVAPTPLADAAGQVLAKQWRRARKLRRHRDSDDGSGAHRLRIALRRLRYLAEAFAPILGEPAERLRKRAHAVEHQMALIRDTSRDLARFSADTPPPPPRFRRHLRDRRKAARGALEEAWSKFDDRTFRRAVLARLETAD